MTLRLVQLVDSFVIWDTEYKRPHPRRPVEPGWIGPGLHEYKNRLRADTEEPGRVALKSDLLPPPEFVWDNEAGPGNERLSLQELEDFYKIDSELRFDSATLTAVRAKRPVCGNGCQYTYEVRRVQIAQTADGSTIAGPTVPCPCWFRRYAAPGFYSHRVWAVLRAVQPDFGFASPSHSPPKADPEEEYLDNYHATEKLHKCVAALVGEAVSAGRNQMMQQFLHTVEGLRGDDLIPKETAILLRRVAMEVYGGIDNISHAAYFGPWTLRNRAAESPAFAVVGRDRQ